MYRPNSAYTPLGASFPTAQADGTTLQTNQSPASSTFPLGSIHSSYGNSSRPQSFASSVRPTLDRNSSSSALLGEYNYGSYPSSGAPFPNDIGGDGRFERQFKHVKQLFHLLGTGSLRFLITAGLIVALYELIWRYASFTVLDTSQKRMFNFLVTALSLALGLNLASSLKSIAVKSRWWILSWEKRPLEEVEEILSSHSLMAVIKLGCKSVFRKPSVTIACSLWLLINIAVQAFVAALGLNWSIESAIDTSSHVPGYIVYSNMSQFYYGDAWDSSSADQTTAHVYGAISISDYYWYNSSSDVPDRLQVIPPLTLYLTNLTEIWDFETYSQYVFLDKPADSDSSVGLFYSNRSITSESKCEVFSEQVTKAQDGTISMRNIILQPNSTTYVTLLGTDVKDASCGSRCTTVYALEVDDTTGYAYSCNVTLSDVTNTTRWDQQLPDNLAQMAGMSIALNGYNSGNSSTAYQSAAFGNEFFYGIYLGGNASIMEWRLRYYAIATIAGADKYNPFVEDGIPGDLPIQGVSLTLDHPGFILAILGGIGGFHLLFFVLAAYLASRAVVIDDGYVAISLILLPVVERLKGHGSLLKNKQICKALGNPYVSYGTVQRQSSRGMIVKHLEISEAAQKPPDRWHGLYD